MRLALPARIRPLLLAALAGLAATGCQDGLDATCEPGSGRVEIGWSRHPDFDRYRVYRMEEEGPAALGEVSGNAFVDATAGTGVFRHYLVRPLLPGGGEGEAVASCSAAGLAAEDAPPAVTDLRCRAKSGKIDLLWSPVEGASGYRVFRSGTGGGQQQVAELAGTSFVDVGLVNELVYDYAVVAVDAGGRASSVSDAASCTPKPRGAGDPPPVVAQPACRGKNDKVDVTWIPVEGAAFYRLYRNAPGAPPAAVGEVAGNVFADFGLPPGAAQQYAVASVSAAGAEAAPSPACDVMPRGRAGANRPPAFTSEPLTSALELHYWWTELAASDPDGDEVSYSLVSGPAGMGTTPAGFLSWTPAESQLGSFVVEVRATDARGAWASQSFAVQVADFDEPPRITSVPVRTGEAGQPYRYDVEAYDPEGAALRFSFGAPVPPGMAVDPASGLVTWTPAPGDTLSRTVSVRAADPSGAFDEQAFVLDVFSGAVDLLAPVGAFEVEVGETLDLEIRSNQPAARLSAFPLPRGATTTKGRLVFTPTEDQVGQYTIAVKALLGRSFDLERITVRVTRPNRPPLLVDPGPQRVDEGGELVIPLAASDPDGDDVTLAPGGALPTNALLDGVGRRLVFRPAYDQGGAVAVAIAASDGRSTSQITVPIQVVDREPPVDFTDLVIDRVQSPTLQPRARISGNVVGTAASDPEPEPFVAVTGLSPASGRQGRTLDVAITGQGASFAAGRTSASFGEGITVETLEVLSPTSARARIAIAPDAALGTRVVRLSGEGPSASSIVAFLVEAGAASLTGQLVDDFTGAPLAGARVVVNGSLVEATTGADGRFRLDGVPAGPQQVLVLRSDYETAALELAVASNAELPLPEPVALRALARPFTPGGSLPRAASAASVLDRGVSTRGGGLDQDQAEAVVADTLVAVGGDLVGVLDESGAQLNPEVRGGGLLVVTHRAVQAQARGLVEGGTHTIGEIGRLLTDAFQWQGPGPDPAALAAALQAYANDAWEDPADPLNAMAIVLLNEGTTLAPRPPVVTPETRLNRFQAFLLVHSILLPTIASLEASADQALRELGVDPDTVVPPSEYGDPPLPVDAVGALERAGGRLLAALAPRDAYAQGGAGVVIPAPNSRFAPYDTPFARSAFTRIAKYAGTNWIAQATIGNAITALTAAAVQGAIAIAAGATGGAVGITAAVGFVASFVGGQVGAAIEKLGFGLALAASASVTQPEPPIPERSFIDETSQKFVLEFDRSVTETSPATGANPLGAAFYSYELYDFPDPRTTDVQQALVVHSAILSEPEEAPDKLRFSIPLAKMTPGVHFYRMAAIRYVSEAEYPLNAARGRFPYESQLGAEDVEIQPSNLLQASFTLDETEQVQVGQNRLRAWQEARQGLPEIDSDVARIDAELALLAKQRHEIHETSVTSQQQFYEQNRRNLIKTEKLLDLAHQHGLAGGTPDDFLDPASPKSAEALRVLREADPGGTLRPEVARQMRDVADSSARVRRYGNAVGVHERAKLEIQAARRQLITAPEGATRPLALRYETFDADGRAVTVERRIPLNAEGVGILGELEEAEVTRQNAASTQLEISERIARADRAGLGDLEIGEPKAQFEGELSRAATEARAIRQETNALDRQRRALQQREPSVRRQRIRERFEYHKPKVQRVLGALNVVAGVVTAQNMWGDYVNAFRVLYSDLSAAFMYVHPDRDFPDTSVAAHPNLYASNGVVLGKPGFQGNARDGAIQTNFLDEIDEDQAFSAGFPPGFLSIDSQGRVYAINMNSTTRFSGRLFRYLPARSFEREFVGTINYWSSLLQYGRPASPVAMTNGWTRYGDEIVETLFIADVDLLDESDTAIGRGRPILKQLPIGLLESGRPYESGSARSHFVAQPYFEDGPFGFSGATNLAAYRDDDVQRLYVSDGSRIFSVVEDLRTGSKQLFMLVNDPSAEWSGLAVSTGAEPTLFFSEFASGAVYALPIREAIAAEAEPERFREACAIGRFGSGSVYDLEVDQTQRRLLATTESGVDNVPMPLLVEAANPLYVVRMERYGRIYTPLRAPTLGERQCTVFLLSQQDHERGTIDLSVSSIGPDGDTVRRYTLQVAPAGPTRAVLP